MSEENKEKPEGEKPEEKEKKKPRFDADQLVFVNQLRDQEIQKERERLEADFQRRLAEREAALKAEIEAAKNKPADKDKKDEPKDKQPDPEVVQLKASFDELRTMFQTVKTEKEQLQQQVAKEQTERRKSRQKDQFLSALTEAKVDFYDPLEAYELASKEGLDYDDTADRVIVKSPATGAARLNENGDPMSVIDFVKDFAKRKNYLVKAPVQDGGTGSHENRRIETEKPKTKDYSTMTPEEFEAERQKILSKGQ